MAKKFWRSPPGVAVVFSLGVWTAIIAAHYPYRTDPPEKIEFKPDAPDQKYYDQAYLEREREKEERYTRIAREAARGFHIEDMVADFVRSNHLENAHVLEVGAGSGLLQDHVKDYTALDISSTVRRYFHKPFVQGDARAMPFPDGTFDALWSIWVLEHVPNPEQALREMRRVLKPNGLMLLNPAWMCSPLSANGYHVRPFKDFGLGGRIVKATIPIESSPLFELFYTMPSRTIRMLSYGMSGKPTTFHYRPLTPNYDEYWEPDSDAVNTLDLYEMYLWFTSRGDECLNCGSSKHMFWQDGLAMVIRVKPTGR